jgi:hypothetical protein
MFFGADKFQFDTDPIDGKILIDEIRMTFAASICGKTKEKFQLAEGDHPTRLIERKLSGFRPRNFRNIALCVVTLIE